MLSCSLPGWRVAVLHPQLDPKYCVCGDRDPRVFLLTVALPSVLSAVQASVTLVNCYVLSQSFRLISVMAKDTRLGGKN